MAQEVGTLAITLTANAAPMMRGLDQARTQIQNFGGTVNVFKSGGGGGLLAGLTGGAGFAAVAAGISAAASAMGTLRDLTVSAGRAAFDLGANAVKLAADYQDAKTSFTTLTGSAAAGTKLLKEVQEFGAATPFQSKDLIAQGQMLMGMGVAADNVIPSLKAIGEITSGMGGSSDRLQRIALAFGQVLAAGRLQGDELRQFAEAGVGRQEFAQTAGMGMTEFNKALEQGLVGAEVMVNTFNRLTSAGGRFFGQMVGQSGNFNARWNNVKESVELGMQDIGLGLIDGLEKSGGMDFAKSSVEWFRANAPGVGEAIGRGFEAARPTLDIVAAGVRAVRDGLASVGRLVSESGFFGLDSASMKTITTNVVGTLVQGFGKLLDVMIKVGGYTSLFVIRPITEFLDNIRGGIAALFDASAAVDAKLGLSKQAQMQRDIAESLRSGRAGVFVRGNLLALERMAFRTDLGNEWATAFNGNMKEAAGGVQDVKKGLEDIGKIKPPESPLSIPADVLKRQLDLAKDFDKADPLGAFRRRQGEILDAGNNLGLGNANPGAPAVQFGLAEAFRDLEKSLGDATQKLPAAAERGSAAAQSAINQALVQSDRQNVQARMLDVMKRAEQYTKDVRDETRRLADEIMRSRVTGRGF